MHARDLRLLEFAPSRTAFDQILADPTIFMGFECEFVTDVEQVQTRSTFRSPPDYNGMNYDALQYEVEVSRRAERRITADYDEWRDDQAAVALRSQWQHDEADYVLLWCLDHEILNPKEELEDASGHTVPDKLVMQYSADAAKEFDKDAASWQKAKYAYTLRWCLNHDKLVSSNNGESVEAAIAAARDDAYSDYYDEHEDDARDSAGDMDDYIDDRFGSNTAFLENFGVVYDEGDEDEEEVDVESEVHQDIAHSLGRFLDAPVHVSNSATDRHAWYVQEDGSIQGDGYVTAEIASPVYQLSEGLQTLKTTFGWLARQGYSTNDSTGFHVSFSIDGKTSAKDYDFLKMMVLFDENYTAQLFDRLGNTYAEQMRTTLFANFSGMASPMSMMSDRTVDEVVAKLRRIGRAIKTKDKNPEVLGFSKYFTFRHRSAGVIEFRSMGGVGYEDKFDIIRKRIVNMAYLMKVGADPTLLARDYVARIYKMLTSRKYSEPELGSGLGRIDTPPVMSALQPVFDRDPKLAKTADANPILFLTSIAALLRAKTLTLTPAQLRQLRFYAAKHRVTADAFYQSQPDHGPYNLIARLMRWPAVVPGDQDARQQVLPFARAGRDMSGDPATSPEGDLSHRQFASGMQARFAQGNLPLRHRLGR